MKLTPVQVTVTKTLWILRISLLLALLQPLSKLQCQFYFDYKIALRPEIFYLNETGPNFMDETQRKFFNLFVVNNDKEFAAFLSWGEKKVMDSIFYLDSSNQIEVQSKEDFFYIKLEDSLASEIMKTIELLNQTFEVNQYNPTINSVIKFNQKLPNDVCYWDNCYYTFMFYALGPNLLIQSNFEFFEHIFPTYIKESGIINHKWNNLMKVCLELTSS